MGSAISDMHLSLRCLWGSRPAYKQPCLSSGLHTIQPPTLERRDVLGAGGGRIVQKHQITNNFPICIFFFLRIVRHPCLMHLPVHPKGVAKLKEACDSRHLPRDVSEIGTVREYKIHDSDNQNGLRTMNNLFPPVISLRSGKVGKTKNKLSLTGAWACLPFFILD